MSRRGLQLRSTVTGAGQLELTLVEVEVPEPAADEVVVRIEASPINPSDLGLLFGGADMTTARDEGTAEAPRITADLPPAAQRAMAGRVDQPMPVGNEAAGTVIATGDSDAARALENKTVAMVGGAMYAEYRVIKAVQCVPYPDDVTPAECASSFVNPLTVLGMVETMRDEGHSALVHTAAASNLGQMLNKVCLHDGIPLVNVVRREEQANLLRGHGAKYVVDSSRETFHEDLVEALVSTGATLAFDATGGGRLASQILTAMEAAQLRNTPGYSGYGSSTHKQVYIYGGLDRSPTQLDRTFGMAWGIGGWLLTPFLQKIGIAGMQALQARVVSEIKTTFASHYTQTVSLSEVLSLEAIATYGRQATGEKVLIDPTR